jgi:hypothetical protein
MGFGGYATKPMKYQKSKACTPKMVAPSRGQMTWDTVSLRTDWGARQRIVFGKTFEIVSIWEMPLKGRFRCTQAACAHILIFRTDRPLCRNGLAEWLLWGAGVQQRLLVIKRQTPLRSGFSKADAGISNALAISTTSIGHAV